MKRGFRVLAAAIAAASPVLLSDPARAADPTTGDCLAASDASLKSGNEHRLRAERAQLLVCAAASCPADVRKECTRRVDEVNAAIPTVIFEAKDAAGNDLSAVKVTMDGEPLADRLDGIALSIDPGAHSFTFDAAGLPPVQKHFVIREAQKDRREPITFGAAAGPEATPQPTVGPPLPQPLAQSNSGLGAQKVLAIVAGGVGVVGLGVGTAFGLDAMFKRDSARKVCPMTFCDSAAGVNLWKDAKTLGNFSTVAFIVGGLGMAGATVLWLTAKPESDRAQSAQVSLGLGAIDVSGRW